MSVTPDMRGESIKKIYRLIYEIEVRQNKIREPTPEDRLKWKRAATQWESKKFQLHGHDVDAYRSVIHSQIQKFEAKRRELLEEYRMERERLRQQQQQQRMNIEPIPVNFQPRNGYPQQQQQHQGYTQQQPFDAHNIEPIAYEPHPNPGYQQNDHHIQQQRQPPKQPAYNNQTYNIEPLPVDFSKSAEEEKIYRSAIEQMRKKFLPRFHAILPKMVQKLRQQNETEKANRLNQALNHVTRNLTSNRIHERGMNFLKAEFYPMLKRLNQFCDNYEKSELILQQRKHQKLQQQKLQQQKLQQQKLQQQKLQQQKLQQQKLQQQKLQQQKLQQQKLQQQKLQQQKLQQQKLQQQKLRQQKLQEERMRAERAAEEARIAEAQRKKKLAEQAAARKAAATRKKQQENYLQQQKLLEQKRLQEQERVNELKRARQQEVVTIESSDSEVEVVRQAKRVKVEPKAVIAKVNVPKVENRSTAPPVAKSNDQAPQSMKKVNLGLNYDSSSGTPGSQMASSPITGKSPYTPGTPGYGEEELCSLFKEPSVLVHSLSQALESDDSMKKVVQSGITLNSTMQTFYDGKSDDETDTDSFSSQFLEDELLSLLS